MFDKTKFLSIDDDATPASSPATMADPWPELQVAAWADLCVCIGGLKGLAHCTCKAAHRYNYREDQRINALLANAHIDGVAWADCNGTVHTGDHLGQPVTFDGEKGTYSDPKCSLCSCPETHEACVSFWMRQGRHH